MIYHDIWNLNLIKFPSCGVPACCRDSCINAVAASNRLKGERSMSPSTNSFLEEIHVCLAPVVGIFCWGLIDGTYPRYS